MTPMPSKHKAALAIPSIVIEDLSICTPPNSSVPVYRSTNPDAYIRSRRRKSAGDCWPTLSWTDEDTLVDPVSPAFKAKQADNASVSTLSISPKHFETDLARYSPPVKCRSSNNPEPIITGDQIGHGCGGQYDHLQPHHHHQASITDLSHGTDCKAPLEKNNPYYYTNSTAYADSSFANPPSFCTSDKPPILSPTKTAPNPLIPVGSPAQWSRISAPFPANKLTKPRGQDLPTSPKDHPEESILVQEHHLSSRNPKLRRQKPVFNLRKAFKDSGYSFQSPEQTNQQGIPEHSFETQITIAMLEQMNARPLPHRQPFTPSGDIKTNSLIHSFVQHLTNYSLLRLR